MKRASTEHARRLRKNPTDAEHLLWRHLRQRQLNGHKFRRQQPIGPYIVDFVCCEKRLIVEVDGGQHADHAVADSRRTMWLERQGFRVMRFWNHEVLTNHEGALEAIQEALGDKEALTPTLPRWRGGQHDKNLRQERR